MGVQPLRRSCVALMLAATAMVPATVAAGPDDPVVIYRCTGDGGRLALRDSPCRPGERQQVLRMRRPQDPPPVAPAPQRPGTPAPVTAPAAPPAPPVQVVVVERTPMYECVTPDGDRYTSDSPHGNPRWVPLWTLGYPARHSRPQPLPPRTRRPHRDNDHLFNDSPFDGIGRPVPDPPVRTPGAPRLPPAAGPVHGAGTWIRDHCTRLAPAQACTQLRERWWELRRARNSALQGERDGIDAEQEAIQARLAREC